MKNTLSSLALTGLLLFTGCASNPKQTAPVAPRPTQAQTPPPPAASQPVAPAPAMLPPIPRTGNVAQLRWFEGGNLHKAKVEAWRRATPDNKLATAADWVAKIRSQRYATMEAMKPDVQNLVIAMNKATEDIPENMELAELAATCMVLMGWTR